MARMEGSSGSAPQTIVLIIVSVFGPVAATLFTQVDPRLRFAFVVWALAVCVLLIIEGSSNRSRGRRERILSSLSRICLGVLAVSVAVLVAIALQQRRGLVEARAFHADQTACRNIDANAVGRGGNSVGRAAVTDDRGYFKIKGLGSGDHYVILYQVVGEQILTAEFVVPVGNSHDSPPGCQFPSSAWEMHQFSIVYFERNSCRLDRQDRREVLKIANLLANDPKYDDCRLVIQGLCSEPGSERHNLRLGERRARAVRDVLVDFGIRPERLLMVSYGESKLADTGDDDAAHARNQRVECILLPHSETYEAFLAANGAQDAHRAYVVPRNGSAALSVGWLLPPAREAFADQPFVATILRPQKDGGHLRDVNAAGTVTTHIEHPLML